MKKVTLLLVLLSTLNVFSKTSLPINSHSLVDLSNDVDFQNYVLISADLGSKVQSTKSETLIELYAQGKLGDKQKIQLVKNLGFSKFNDLDKTILQLTASYNSFSQRYAFILKSKEGKTYLTEAFTKVAIEKNLFKSKQPDCLALWGAMMAACLLNANLMEQQFGAEAANIYYIVCVSGAFVFLAGCEGIV
ncbi:MAG: hypothetical protein SFU21_16295 [Flavihumibacter sp.]|nr:hypothetical protein [Flavihumibacter sp.]